MMIGAAHRGFVPVRGAFLYALRLLVFSAVAVAIASYAGCVCRMCASEYAGEPAVNLWSGVLAGYSTGGLAHPRHFGFFDRKQVA